MFNLIQIGKYSVFKNYILIPLQTQNKTFVRTEASKWSNCPIEGIVIGR